MRFDPCGTVIILSSWEVVVFLEKSCIWTAAGNAVCWRGHWDESSVLKRTSRNIYILRHSFRSLQSILGLLTAHLSCSKGSCWISTYARLYKKKKKVSFLWDNHDRGEYGLVPLSHLLFLVFFWLKSIPFLGLVSMYSVTGWSQYPVCFRAR